jgi:hypothetical protein
MKLPRITRAWTGVFPLLAVAALFGAVNKPAPVGGAVSEIVNAVPDIPGAIVQNVARRSYPGFDTNIYPGDGNMRAWRDDSHYEWVGYYLKAPCHKDASWSGKRQTLKDMGWGLAVIYVGQQTWDRVPSHYETRYKKKVKTVYVKKRVKKYVRRNGKRVARYVTRSVPVKRTVSVPYRVAIDPVKRPLDECGSNLVNGERGTMEARDAIARTESEGFARGTVIFLDVERMERTPMKMRDYYRAWVRRVLEDGRYRPGIYAHTHNADLIYGDVKAEYEAAGRSDEPPFWIANSRGFSPDKEPHEVGHSFAAVWQGKLDTYERRNGVRLPIDINVAAVPSPSEISLGD